MNVNKITVANVSFTKDRQKCESTSEQTKSHVARNIGVATGIALSAGLVYTQLKSLKTVTGKRYLVAGFNENGKSLNDVIPRVVKRGENGKILPLNNQPSDRSKEIVKGLKMTLAVWSAGITALSTAIGGLIDSNINASRQNKNA
jgi:hypothetical protein